MLLSLFLQMLSRTRYLLFSRCLACFVSFFIILLSFVSLHRNQPTLVTSIEMHSTAQILPSLDWSSKHGGANVGGKQRQSFNRNGASSARGDPLRKLFHTTGAKVLYYIRGTWMSGPTYTKWNTKLDWGLGVIHVFSSSDIVRAFIHPPTFPVVLVNSTPPCLV